MNKYTETMNQSSLGGEIMKMKPSVNECKVACNEMTDCVGFDFNFKSKVCYSHDQYTIKSPYENADVIQYSRECVEPPFILGKCFKMCFLLSLSFSVFRDTGRSL